MLYGSLEAGGTKMVMGIVDDTMQVLRSTSCPTRLPSETMQDVIGFFQDEPISALGIASFGPVNLDTTTDTYGSITNTPKLAWRDFPMMKTLRDALGVPCAIDTDVNASALAEATLGAAQGLKNCVYFTVGTGIGAGVLSEGHLVHGMLHPEWGHVMLSRYESDPLTRGVCPYHTHCAEGFASGPSMQTRWGMPAAELPDDHRAWDIEAYYLAQLCLTAVMTVSPERILLGGGVMHRETLFPLIHKHLNDMIGGYLVHERLDRMDEYVCPPKLYPDSGLMGGALLARQLLAKS